MKITKLASIDVGSNAIRLLINYIYEIEGQKPIFNKASLIRVPIRLGEDVFTKNKISGYNINRLIDAMKSFKLLMDVFGVEAYRAAATSAMRESENGRLVVEMVREKSGINLEIIDGETEADIIFSTELSEYLNPKRSYLYVDVGGGSTEITLFHQQKPIERRSFPVGTVRFLEHKVDDQDFKGDMKQWIKKITKNLLVDLIGSGGNINYVFKRSGLSDKSSMNPQFVLDMYEELKNMSVKERISKYNMKPDRADVIEPALNIYSQIIKWSGAQNVYVPKIGLSDGIIQHLYQSTKKDEIAAI